MGQAGDTWGHLGDTLSQKVSPAKHRSIRSYSLRGIPGTPTSLETGSVKREEITLYTRKEKGVPRYPPRESRRWLGVGGGHLVSPGAEP
jgi:hypothetical protein